MSCVGQDAGDVGQHAGLVGHAAGAGSNAVTTSSIGRIGVSLQRVGLEREVRHAVLGVGGVQPRDVDQVGDHGEAVGSAPAPLP